MNTTGIFQLKDGTWGYRFKICVNGKIIDRRRTRDENGNSFKNKSEAFHARKAAIYQAENTPPIREEQVLADAPVKSASGKCMRNIARTVVKTGHTQQSKSRILSGQITFVKRSETNMSMRFPLRKSQIF